MKKEILFLSVTEFFPVYSKLCLKDIANCHHLSLRYPNEEHSQIENDLQQIENMIYEDFQLRGLASEYMPFYFNAHLANRMERYLKENKPEMIFVELGALTETEFKLLSLLNHLTEECPIAVVLPEEEKTTNKIFNLLNNGVKEVLYSYDYDVLRNAYTRHVTN